MTNATLATPAPSGTENAAGDTHALEIVTFRIADGTQASAFAAAAGALEPLLKAQPGFVSRRLGVDERGLWTDVVEWRSMPEALLAAETLVREAAFAPFAAMIDTASVEMRHATLQHRLE